MSPRFDPTSAGIQMIDLNIIRALERSSSDVPDSDTLAGRSHVDYAAIERERTRLHEEVECILAGFPNVEFTEDELARLITLARIGLGFPESYGEVYARLRIQLHIYNLLRRERAIN